MICAAVVLWGASMSGLRPARVLRTWSLRLNGDLSYCLYLIHFMVMDLYDVVVRTLREPAILEGFEGVLIRAVVVLITSFVLALISRRALERPALSLKRFFEAPQITAKHSAIGIPA
jgi:peptidoglycan/LPS O-acetylase OafA/YrhL